MNDLTEQATALRALPPSCGPVRLIAVDGHAGSGKTTFATRLSAALDGAPVLRLDDLATHERFFGWGERLRSQVIEPLSRGASARYAPYDWTLRRFTAPRPLPPAPVVIIEGVGAGRRALRPSLARLFWMDRDAEGSWERGRRRDGPALSAFWDAWTTAETRHFSADPSRPFADALVTERQTGYVIRTGPVTTARTDQTITQRDQLPPPY
ncbi:uridine kinase [Streptomyces sp. NPDC056652]|uniref:uridine kinase family protein n=1 Tax=Streptomyces sp. NPDC056652 TaxID=3345893 RepID=UPI00367C4047